jgi:hypothetical protein
MGALGCVYSCVLVCVYAHGSFCFCCHPTAGYARSCSYCTQGCGLVEYTTAHAAASAIASLNNTELKGREIHVREVRLIAVLLACALLRVHLVWCVQDQDEERRGGAAAAYPVTSSGGGSGTRVFIGNVRSSVAVLACPRIFQP